MRQYNLSESRIKRIIRHPARLEEGILEGAVACMQPAGGKKYSEIWTMYLVAQGGFLGSSDSRHVRFAPAAKLANGRRDFLPSAKPSKSLLPLSGIRRNLDHHSLIGGKGKKLRIITAWRYPGKSPERDPIPADVLREIKDIIL